MEPSSDGAPSAAFGAGDNGDLAAQAHQVAQDVPSPVPAPHQPYGVPLTHARSLQVAFQPGEALGPGVFRSAAAELGRASFMKAWPAARTSSSPACPSLRRSVLMLRHMAGL